MPRSIGTHPDFVIIPTGSLDDSEGWNEEISPECRAMLAALDVPVELLDFDYEGMQ